jgi:hypothetical protein
MFRRSATSAEAADRAKLTTASSSSLAADECASRMWSWRSRPA